MKLKVFQKKDSYLVYIVVSNLSKVAYISTGVKTNYPIKRMPDADLGFSFDRREQNRKVKLKRIEDMYWKLDEYCIDHPLDTPQKVKMAMAPTLSNRKQKGKLVQTFEEYISSGKVSKSTAAIMQRTAKKIELFDPDATFAIEEMWLDRFTKYLKDEGAKPNGVGLHLRNLRTIFNYARKRHYTKEYPFLDYSIKVERKPVRNMTLAQIREFRDYPCEPWQVEYRDIFMLMVYLGGVNVGDLLTCKGLVNGRLMYQRKKTDHPISVPVHPAAMDIIKKYAGTQYLINACDRYKDYHGYLHRMNDGLKKIGKCKIVPDKVGKLRKKAVEPFFDGLSTYVARYSFASIAAEIGISRDIIAACLGHSWSDVTSHYIAYSQKQIDEAIMKVCDQVCSG